MYLHDNMDVGGRAKHGCQSRTCTYDLSSRQIIITCTYAGNVEISGA